MTDVVLQNEAGEQVIDLSEVRTAAKEELDASQTEVPVRELTAEEKR